MTWINLGTPADATLVATVWPESDRIDASILSVYIGAARDACVAYAPELAAGDPFPDSWRLAQITQARNLFDARLADPQGSNDGSSYGLSTKPLDWHVRQLLRPRRGGWVVG